MWITSHWYQRENYAVGNCFVDAIHTSAMTINDSYRWMDCRRTEWFSIQCFSIKCYSILNRCHRITLCIFDWKTEYWVQNLMHQTYCRHNFQAILITNEYLCWKFLLCICFIVLRDTVKNCFFFFFMQIVSSAIHPGIFKKTGD